MNKVIQICNKGYIFSYPMEMHFVHFKKMYGDIGNSLSKPDGLAVLGVFFELQEHENPDLEPLISALKDIQNPGRSRNKNKKALLFLSLVFLIKFS